MQLPLLFWCVQRLKCFYFSTYCAYSVMLYYPKLEPGKRNNGSWTGKGEDVAWEHPIPCGITLHNCVLFTCTSVGCLPATPLSPFTFAEWSLSCSHAIPWLYIISYIVQNPVMSETWCGIFHSRHFFHFVTTSSNTEK